MDVSRKGRREARRCPVHKEEEEFSVKVIRCGLVRRRRRYSAEEVVTWARKNSREDSVEPLEDGLRLARVGVESEGGNVREEVVHHGADVRTAPVTRGKEVGVDGQGVERDGRLQRQFHKVTLWFNEVTLWGVGVVGDHMGRRG